MFRKPTDRILNHQLKKLQGREEMNRAYEERKRKQREEIQQRFIDSQKLKYSNVDRSTLGPTKMRPEAKAFLQENMVKFYNQAASMYSKVNYVPFQGYTVSCDEEPALQGVSYEQMLYFSRNDETILKMKEQFSRAGVGLFIKERHGRLVVMASSNKQELEHYKEQFRFMDESMFSERKYNQALIR